MLPLYGCTGEGPRLLLRTRVPLPCRSKVPSDMAGASERACSGSAILALLSWPGGPASAATTVLDGAAAGADSDA